MDQSSILDFRSGTFFAPILVLYNNDLEKIEQRLEEKIASAPDFFSSSPVLFDLSELNENDKKIDVEALISLLRRLSLFPVGIRGGDPSQEKRALELSVPVDSGRSRNDAILPEIQRKDDTMPEVQPVIREAVRAPAMMITQPVRSGQRIYAASDLVILAQVSAGAEIMAEGNIHVYNTLRGRALAGVQGDTAARFFCLDLQAELVSIAGIYKTSEDLKETPKKKPVQVYLRDQALIIEELS
ncbi:MAG: Septum site-determining protein MinC [Nitrosomonas europaea]|uniref:septum site-determining protein MinC n=1 Tax=Nitrosomonas TaxID=914 RepID=UPI0023F54D81|nr:MULTISPECIES: septum site-determining protein MinC [Nitrosomonas]MBV6389565.1 Septum site-determining protein MinC [Nitrosomonas europaea]